LYFPLYLLQMEEKVQTILPSKPGEPLKETKAFKGTMLEIDNVDILFLLSPRSPKLNGGVGRFHRIVREEFCPSAPPAPHPLHFNSASTPLT